MEYQQEKTAKGQQVLARDRQGPRQARLEALPFSAEIKMSVLQISLSAAVPLWIEEMKKVSPEERRTIAQECSQIVAEHGDDILYRGHKKGATATAFNALARGMAVLSFAPGGVKAFGMHFETLA